VQSSTENLIMRHRILAFVQMKEMFELFLYIYCAMSDLSDMIVEASLSRVVGINLVNLAYYCSSCQCVAMERG